MANYRKNKKTGEKPRFATRDFVDKRIFFLIYIIILDLCYKSPCTGVCVYVPMYVYHLMFRAPYVPACGFIYLLAVSEA